MATARELTIAKLATVTGIDAKTVAITTLYTVPPGKRLVPMGVIIRCTSFTVGTKSVQAVASFGSNSATWDNYLNSVTYTISAVQMTIHDTVLDTEYLSVAAGGTFKISIETGSNADVETWSVSLFGFIL
jgi:hypothetical protein